MVADQTSTKQALFAAIETEAQNVDKATGGVYRASILRDLALAYRYVSGGAQPGSVTIEK